MNGSQPAGGQAALPEGEFEGREAFEQLVRDALANAAAQGWREIVLCDASFEDWPLGERAVAQSLHDWSQAGRTCILLARRWEAAAFRHARFVEWRKRWSHIVDARACPSADEQGFPSAIWTPTWAMERRDPERNRGISSTEAGRRVLLREKLDEWLRKSGPSFAATRLGL